MGEKYKIHCNSTNFIEDWPAVTQQRKHRTVLTLLAADSVADTISFITGILFCDPKTSFSQIRPWLRPDLSSKIQPGLALAGFEKVKSGASLLTRNHM